MSLEIERKFLVVGDSYRKVAHTVHIIKQGYINKDPASTVRVRLYDNQGFITVKTRNQGATRNEWEFEIAASEASEILGIICCDHVISKRRYVVDAGNGLSWEVDEFDGRLSGLVIAEIELPSEDTSFEKPDFVGMEVTDDPQYYNSNLVARV